MSTTPAPVAAEQQGTGGRIRNLALGSAFAVILVLPKILHLRRHKSTWLAFRFLLGISGAALVILPLSIWNSWLPGIAGLALFLAAILLPATPSGTTAAEKAKELGALIVLNGGEYQPENGPTVAAQLFVRAENIWVLDSAFKPLLIIPIAAVSSANAAESQGQWIVRIRWNEQTADFHYRGVFAGHLASVAESTVRSMMHPELRVLPQKRAAGA
jgi:hypothetical protein